MMLIEETTVPDAALPVAEFRAHLRLGTGFGDESLQDDVLNGFLRAAIAAIEARTGKVLISRDFTWTLTGWRDRAGQVLPVAPVNTINQVLLIDEIDMESELAGDAFRLERDSERPRLRPAGSLLPMIRTGGSVRIAFTAGFAESWGGLPADLGHAVMLLAAHYYEHRNESSLSDGSMPFGVSSLIQRYRVMRIGVGVAR
ncbi:head-tail connector protein [Sedimentitalea sp. XS_ASV28]|uniref:head-tail connector protein n=1 Tax=Sedimentitalea sp. XS_ASV28 TaxID=3241296 RepID=UPI0035174162